MQAFKLSKIESKTFSLSQKVKCWNKFIPILEAAMDVCFTSTMCYFKKGRILPVIEFPVYCMQSLPRKK